jgi:hypothetical protein
VTWDVTLAANSNLGRLQKIGVFALKNGQLTYLSTNNASRRLLPFCLLRLRARSGNLSDSEVCRLWSPIEIPDVRVSFAKSKSVLDLLPPELRSLSAKSLRLVIQPVGFGDIDFPDGKELKAGRTIQLIVFDPELAGEKLLATLLTLSGTGSGAQLQVEHTATVADVVVRKLKATNKEIEVGISRPELTRLLRDAEKQLPSIQKLIRMKVLPEIAKGETYIKTGTAILSSSSRTTSSSSSRSSTGLSTAERLLAQRQLSEAKVKLDELVKNYEGLLDATASLESLVAWTESTNVALDTLEKDARLGIQLVRQTSDGHRIVILRTPLAAVRVDE